MTTGEKIKLALEESNIRQNELAKKMNISESSISQWINNITVPRMPKLQKLAMILCKNTSDLMGDEYNVNNTTNCGGAPNTTSDYITFPVVGEIAAGYNTPPLEDWEGEKIDVPTSYLNGRDASEYFVLVVKGNSMYPHYQEGDKVLILRQNIPDYSGQVAAVIYDNEFATLKKIEYPPNKEWVKLVPVNPNFEEQKIEKNDLENFIIMGVPKLLIRDIDKA